MKKLLLFAIALILAIPAFAQDKGKENNEMRKTLVVYFSATGTTKAAAQRLAKEKNADLYEIVPEQLYTDADLNWRDKTICVFATSGGSGVSGSANDLKKAYPQYTWGESRLMN